MKIFSIISGLSLGVILIFVVAYMFWDYHNFTHSSDDAVQIVAQKLSMHGPFSVKLLKGGISGAQIFLVTTQEKKVVVRFIVQKDYELRSSEVTCHTIAAAAMYGPDIYYVDAQKGIVIMEFLENQDLSKSQKWSPELCKNLADLLHKIHDGPRFPRTVNIFERIQKYINLIKAVSNDVPIVKIQNMLNIMRAALEKYLTEVPCHFDLHPFNMFIKKNGTIKVIDFETAANGEPFCDVASIAVSYCSDINQEQLLLESYLKRKPQEKD